MDSGRIKPVAFYRGQVNPKRRKEFKHHAMRWKRGMAASRAGELIQIDHMSIGLTGSFMVKEFKGTCPVTGMSFMRLTQAQVAVMPSGFYTT